MCPLGLIECFYGRPWPIPERESYAAFLAGCGFRFYIYGPKGDPVLRRDWRQSFSPEALGAYQKMREGFHAAGLGFGLILSPQGLNQKLEKSDLALLSERVRALDQIGLDYLALFFDDMKGAPDLAKVQTEIAAAAQKCTSAKLVMCPSYYSDDTLLDLLFGDRPKNYLCELGENLPAEIEIVWTGPQIISADIGADHLRQVSSLLRRKPFICDNFYADDGAIGCNYLRILPPSGRDAEALAEASAWALNPMNQPELSKIVIDAFSQHVLKGVDSRTAFQNALHAHCGLNLVRFIRRHYKSFASDGLVEFSEIEKNEWREFLAQSSDPAAREIIRWLNGEYSVALDAILDQSSFEI